MATWPTQATRVSGLAGWVVRLYMSTFFPEDDDTLICVHILYIEHFLPSSLSEREFVSRVELLGFAWLGQRRQEHIASA